MKVFYITLIYIITFSSINAQKPTTVITGNKVYGKNPGPIESIETTFTQVTTINLDAVSHGTTDWGDFDNDGDLDLLITGYKFGGTAISKIFQNLGNDTFTYYTSLLSTGLYYGASAWGDYDNDGDLDILLTGNTGYTVVSKIFRNENGSFIEQSSISIIGVERSSVAWGDYDNDGDLDILLSGNTGYSTVSKIYRNEGDNIFSEQTSINIIGTSKSSLDWGDYDNDGDLDFILMGEGPGAGGEFTRIYRNEGNNSFSAQTSIPLMDVGDGSLDWGDYDNDGDLDILITGSSISGRVSMIYRNEGSNIFALQSSIYLTGVSNSMSENVTWGDYDNDGDLDILLTGLSDFGRVSKIYRNNSDNTFTEMTSIDLLDVYDSSVAWGDYDNDGDLDIILTGSSLTNLRNTIVYKNNSTVVNNLPSVPSNLDFFEDSAGVTLSWDKSLDNETPQDGLKYNIVIGTTHGAVDIFSPMSDRNTGNRRIVDMGNCNHNNSWRVKGLAEGTYYWSVQAIDNNFAGSNFSPEEIFSIGQQIAVLSPNGGEVWLAGSIQNIIWNSTDVVDVKIEFSSDNGINWISIVDSVPSTGIYDWTVPNVLTSQGRIKISDITDPNIFDISDGPFTIQSSKVITVLTPNGGEQIEGGSNYDITWSSTDVEFVDIEYSINNGASWNSIVDSVQSTGIYLWETPNIQTIQGRVKISDHSLQSIYDVSDQPFSIIYTVPVELSSFTASVYGKTVLLNWSTATETNNHLFEIERKAENDEYFTIGFVEGAGTTTEPQDYNFIDQTVEKGVYVYRLKQIDFDGSYDYSNEIEINFPAKEFILFQNFPNPFNPTTKIQFNIPEKSFVTLSVYDILGNLISTLISEYKPAGSYTVEFGGADIPSGLYIYKIITPNFTEAKKMILMK